MSEFLRAGQNAEPLAPARGRGPQSEDSSPAIGNQGAQQQALLKGKAGGLAGMGNKQLNGMLQTPGPRPLQAEIRAKLERSLKSSLSDLQVVTGKQAKDETQQAGTRAFAQGKQIVLADGGLEQDLELMAHETIHVLQQRDQGKPAGPGQQPDANATSGRTEAPADRSQLEQEAAAGAKQVAAGETFGVRGKAPAGRMAENGEATAPDANSDKSKWEKSWNDNPSLQNFFKGDSRPKGTPKERYDKLCPLFKNAGTPDIMEYLKANVPTESAKFFEFSTPAHKDMHTALKTAEAALKKKNFTEMKGTVLTSVWALNCRTMEEGGSKLSNHAWGKAVDFDPGKNPMIRKEGDRRVISLVNDQKSDHMNKSLGWDELKQQSDTFKNNYSLAKLEEKSTQVQGKANATKIEIDALNKAIAGFNAEKKKIQAIKEKNDRKKENDRLTGEIAKNKALLKTKTMESQELKKDLDALTKAISSEKASLKVDRAAADAPLELAKLQMKRTGLVIEQSLASTQVDPKSTEGKKVLAEIKKKLDALDLEIKKQKKVSDAATKAKKNADEQGSLRNWAKSGFLNLPKELVEALTDTGGANLTWGGAWSTKDSMHFELKS